MEKPTSFAPEKNPSSSKDQLSSNPNSLVLTDVLYLSTVALVLYWALNPFVQDLSFNPLARWFPILLTFGVLALGWIGRGLNGIQWSISSRRGLVSLMWPFWLFGTFVLAGSVYGRFVRSVAEPFMVMGLFALVGGWVTAWWILTSRAQLAVIRALSGIHLLWAAVSLISAIFLFPNEQVYHALEHLVIPVLAMPYFAFRHKGLRAVGLVLPILAAVALNKLTAHLVLLLVLAVIGADFVRVRMASARSYLHRLTIAYGAAVGVFLAMGLAVGIYLETKSVLPSGNADYRLYTYERALNRFVDSPFWGRLFIESSVDYFDLYTVNSGTQYLPTHSDWLDILANGGVFAMFPLIYGFLRLLRATKHAINDRNRWIGHEWLRAHCVLHAMVIVAGLVVCTINPVLNITSQAWIFWMSVGILAAIVLITSQTTPTVLPLAA
jgi:O-Antigen ligase